VTADNLDYFQQRAEAELELAQSAEHANAVRAHYVMAGHYLDLVHNDEAQAALAAQGEAGSGVSGGLDEWAIRYASKTSQEHGDLAPDYVTARIEACRIAGDHAGVRLWEQVLNLVEADPIGKALTAG
jgi:hypothetical protein